MGGRGRGEEEVEPRGREVEHVQVERGERREVLVRAAHGCVRAGEARDLERCEVAEERARSRPSRGGGEGGGAPGDPGAAQGERRGRGLREGARGGEEGEEVGEVVVLEVEREGGERGEREARQEREEGLGLEVGEHELLQ